MQGVIHCKLCIIFHFQKRYTTVKLHVQYDFASYIVVELTVNNLTVFFSVAFLQSFTIKFTVIVLQFNNVCVYGRFWRNLRLDASIPKINMHFNWKENHESFAYHRGIADELLPFDFF